MQFPISPADFIAKVKNTREEYSNTAYGSPYSTRTIRESYRIAKDYRNQCLMPLAFPVGAEVTSETRYAQTFRETHKNWFTIKKVNKDGTITTTGGGRYKVEVSANGYFLTRWGTKGYHKTTKVISVITADQPVANSNAGQLDLFA